MTKQGKYEAVLSEKIKESCARAQNQKMQKNKTRRKELLRSWVCSEHTEKEKREIAEIAEKFNINRTVAGLVYDRVGKAGPDAAGEFINSKGVYHDPFMLADMDKACERILKAIEEKEKVTVYGDYDVDGVTSVAVLVSYLRACGLYDCGYYIPNRIGEGYGLCNSAIDKIADGGSTLMITVDTGITAKEEVGYAKSAGLDTVVTDHHECRRGENGEMILPDAPSVNPRRDDCKAPFKELAGVGVAFKLVCALEMKRSSLDAQRATEIIADRYSELVAIGTIADVMPLVDENRTIVKAGLENMYCPRFVGTKELLSLCVGADYDKDNPKKISSSFISFTIAPRINAVGRMSSATEAVKLFLCEQSEEAAERAAALCEMNTVRQREENAILSQALEKMESIDPDDKVIVLDDDSWHHGVIGIVASRISEKYSLPCILISFEGNTGEHASDKDIGKGSGRSIKGLDLVKALEETKETLLKFGGHELAAGLSLERGKTDEFRKLINRYASQVMKDTEKVQSISADAELGLSQLSYDFACQLSILEPCGQANPSPRFILKDLVIEEIYPLKDGRHIKLVLSHETEKITALWFGMKYSDFEYCVGDYVDLLAHVEINEFMGKSSVQVHIKDMKPSEKSEEKLISDAAVYNRAIHGGELLYDLIPDREDFAAVYRYLRANSHEREDYSYALICAHASHKKKLEYIKLRAVLDIMCELSLINYFAIDEKNCRIEMNNQGTKVDLESSELYASLKRRAIK